MFGPCRRAMPRACREGSGSRRSWLNGGRPISSPTAEPDWGIGIDQFVAADFAIARYLRAFKATSIEVTPDKLGEFTFARGMNMRRGTVIVRAVRYERGGTPF